MARKPRVFEPGYKSSYQKLVDENAALREAGERLAKAIEAHDAVDYCDGACEIETAIAAWRSLSPQGAPDAKK